MRNNANVASRDRAATDDSVMPGTGSTSWDPHEVWLTRVKQPRDRAARLLADNAMNPTRKLPE
jgi:hypothetical protein